MVVRYLDFSMFHNKNPVAGSTFIRMLQLEKYWPEFERYTFGEKVDAMIFQKVYMTPDYKFPQNLKAVKILDMCDADWMNGMTAVVETIQAVDAVTCSSERMKEFISQFTDKPVVYVPDRFDIEAFPKPKEHTAKAETVVWFGYSHNAELLRPAMKLIDQLGLNLLVVADDDPMAWRWVNDKFKERYTYKKHVEDSLYQNLQWADFCVLPEGSRPVDAFKSDNKTTRAILCGLPVAITPEAVEHFIEAKNRQAFIEENYVAKKSAYDVRKSVVQYKELIKKLSED